MIALQCAQCLLQYDQPDNYDAISRFQPACGAALAAVYSGQVHVTNLVWLPLLPIVQFKVEEYEKTTEFLDSNANHFNV